METILGIIGVLIAGAAFYYSFLRKPNEELNHLKVQFRATQSLSKSVQKDIQEYAEKTDSWDRPMFTGIPFRTYLEQMKESYEYNLSEKIYNDLSKLPLTKTNIQSMTKSLEQQFSALQQIQAETKMLLRQVKQ